MVRDLDAYEKAALTAALTGGNRKKTKDLIDMKIKEKRKSLKGGTKVPDTLNPTGYNLNTTGQHDNEEIVTAFNACEGTHYSSAQRAALPSVLGSIANTNSPHDLSRLRNCVGAAFGKTGQGFRTAVPGAPPMPGPVTQAQGDKVAATPATYETVITPDGTQPSGASGGSRKNKSRFINKLGSSSRNMARKSSRRSTRKGSKQRKGSRKTRRSNRK